MSTERERLPQQPERDRLACQTEEAFVEQAEQNVLNARSEVAHALWDLEQSKVEVTFKSNQPEVYDTSISTLRRLLTLGHSEHDTIKVKKIERQTKPVWHIAYTHPITEKEMLLRELPFSTEKHVKEYLEMLTVLSEAEYVLKQAEKHLEKALHDGERFTDLRYAICPALADNYIDE